MNNFYQGLAKNQRDLKETIVLNTCKSERKFTGQQMMAFENRFIDGLSSRTSAISDLEFIREKTYRRTGSESCVVTYSRVASGIDSQNGGRDRNPWSDQKSIRLKRWKENRPVRYSIVCFKKFPGCKMGSVLIPGYPRASKPGQCIVRACPSDFGRIDQCRFLVVGAGEVAESAPGSL